MTINARTWKKGATEELGTSQISQIGYTHPLLLQLGDLLGVVLIELQLIRPKNYMLWSQSLRVIGKEKIRFQKAVYEAYIKEI